MKRRRRWLCVGGGDGGGGGDSGGDGDGGENEDIPVAALHFVPRMGNSL